MKYSVLGFGFIASSHRHTKVDMFTKYTKCLSTAIRTWNKYDLYFGCCYCLFDRHLAWALGA